MHSIKHTMYEYKTVRCRVRVQSTLYNTEGLEFSQRFQELLAQHDVA